MNIFIWIAAGLVLAWVTFSFLQWNSGRGLTLALVIGATGGLIGGKVVAPMFTPATAVVPTGFSPTGLIFAVIVAIGVLAITNLALNRGGH